MQYNPDELKEILNIYKAESEEIIQGLNDGFMELEKTPHDKAPLKKLLQLAHSLKGASRMLGFNCVQNMAHKLEDILSFWKKDDVSINVKAFELIYKTCDMLGKSVEKCVETQNDYSDNNTATIIDELSKLIILNKMIPAEETKIANPDLIQQKSMDIKAILLELMFISEKDDTDINNNDSTVVLFDNLKQLAEIFDQTEHKDIKDKISDLIQYVSGIDQSIETEELKEKIHSLNDSIYNLCKDINPQINQLKQEKKPKETEGEQEQATEKEVSTLVGNIDEINSKIDFILTNLSSAKYDKNYIGKLSETVEFLISNVDNPQVNTILSKIHNIFGLLLSKNILINNDTYVAILQSLYFIRRILNNIKEEKNNNNINLQIQRLSVAEDMINSADTKESAPVEIKKKDNIPNENYSQLKNNVSNIDLQEIKTLRVDTAKLDNLISQTGELLINGIKTREHIVELAKINSKLIKWNSVSKKILNYLKYLEKKGFFLQDSDDSSNTFFKRAQDFFVNNAEIINEINNDFSNLYNIISEDDNKLHQTAMEIETIAKGIRVLPLATLFHSFPRMIRDIANENNKKINFLISGSDTTVDKKIIEEIKMPLIHILRNSISHGIETPEDRIKNGKPETGTVKLNAKQVENNVIITIEDDGYGVNLERVKRIAIKKGLLTEDEAEMADNSQFMKLLFLPGFSTEESINEISGRGIGLDVVKSKINNLNGDILIESVLNKGCRVSIRLPLSMSTIKTFVILVDGQKYALPVSAIKYVKQIKREDIFQRNGIDSIIYEEHSIPIYSMSKILGREREENSDTYTVIIIENQERQAAFIVDKLLGDYEVIQKKLMPPIVRIRNISGFTTLSTGEICLIINPFELIRNAV